MMNAFKIFLLALFASMTLSTAAWAQDVVTDDEFGVNVTRPAGWTDVEGNDRAVFNFRHEESHSQIEVIGTQLMTPEVADVFFDTFHESLTNSEFVSSSEEERSYGAHTGTETLYTFTHSSVTLRVAVFQFVSDTVAWLTVAYIQEDAYDEQSPAYAEVVESIAFAAGE